jgi:hypothetical protein
MSNRLIAGLVGIVLAALFTAPSGCSRAARTRFVMTVEFIEGEIKATIRPSGPGVKAGHRAGQSQRSGPNSAVFTFCGHELQVDKKRIVLDGKEQAQLRPRAKKVELEYIAEKLKGTVDGAPLEITGSAK